MFTKKSQESEKIQFQNDLLNLYDDWAKYFPTKKGRNDIGNILSAKAQSMIDFKIGSNAEIYTIFDDAFKTDSKSFSNPKRLYSYFKTFYEIYKSEEVATRIASYFILNEIDSYKLKLNEFLRVDPYIEDLSKFVINPESGCALGLD